MRQSAELLSVNWADSRFDWSEVINLRDFEIYFN